MCGGRGCPDDGRSTLDSAVTKQRASLTTTISIHIAFSECLYIYNIFYRPYYYISNNQLHIIIPIVVVVYIVVVDGGGVGVTAVFDIFLQ